MGVSEPFKDSILCKTWYVGWHCDVIRLTACNLYKLIYQLMTSWIFQACHQRAWSRFAKIRWERNSVGTVTVFSCDQAALWMVQSVRPSVRPSVRLSVCLSVTPFWLCSHHRIIMKLSEDITKNSGKVHVKGQVQRSNVKVTKVTTQLNRLRTVTPVWIHIWWWNDAYSLMMLRRGVLLFFKVIRQISRSHGSKKRRIWPRLGVYGL